MATKIRDCTKLAADICDAVGKDNIISAAHCATLYERYEKPLFIVENGFGAIDELKPDHTCDDGYRIDCLRAHIEEMKKAVGLHRCGVLYHRRAAQALRLHLCGPQR